MTSPEYLRVAEAAREELGAKSIVLVVYAGGSLHCVGSGEGDDFDRGAKAAAAKIMSLILMDSEHPL